MSVSPGKALVEMTDKELRELLSQVSGKERYLHFGYNDILHEIERRTMVAEAARTFWLSIVALIIAAASLIISIVLALFGRSG